MSSFPFTPQQQIGALADERLVQLLSEVFAAPVVRPGVPHDKLLFEAGCASVVTYLRECRGQARVL